MNNSTPAMPIARRSVAKTGLKTALAAVQAGEIDATFRAVAAGPLPGDLVADLVIEDPLQLLAGPAHPLAGARSLTPGDLAGHRIWIPGIRPGTEWAAFYANLAAAYGLRIDGLGPNFGTEALLDAIADSAGLATLVGASDRYIWPAGYDLRRHFAKI
jgi:DNA-binding transcriptional LysR family regulator